MKEVLFLCTHNSARSQMAEGWLRSLGGENFTVYSAGTEKTFVRPQAVQVMKEVGIDISHQVSKTLNQYLQKEFEEVITVCDSANESCPIFPHVKNRRHWSFPDPSQATGTEAVILDVYRHVRDAIKAKIQVELLS